MRLLLLRCIACQSLLRREAKDGASLLSKLALSAGSTAGAQRRGSIQTCGGGDAYHYSPVVQTNSG